MLYDARTAKPNQNIGISLLPSFPRILSAIPKIEKRIWLVKYLSPKAKICLTPRAATDQKDWRNDNEMSCACNSMDILYWQVPNSCQN